MKSVQRGKLPASIALSRSRPLLSRSLATRASASASVRFAIPCWVRKWNLTQTRSLAALIIEKVWLPKRCMLRKLFGMPRSDITMVTWCSASGSSDQKSQLLSALRSPVRGSRLMADTANVRTIGIDTGKNTLHMIGLDEKGAIVLLEKVARTRIAARFVNLPPCLVGIEAGM